MLAKRRGTFSISQQGLYSPDIHRLVWGPARPRPGPACPRPITPALPQAYYPRLTPRPPQAHPRGTRNPQPSTRPSPASPIGFPSQSFAGKTMFGPGQGTGGGLEFPKHTDPLGVAQQQRPVRNGAHWLLLAERRGTFSISPRGLYCPDTHRFLWGLGSAPGGPPKKAHWPVLAPRRETTLTLPQKTPKKNPKKCAKIELLEDDF